MKFKSFLFAIFFLSLVQVKAQDITTGLWWNAEKTSKVQFYENAGKYYGKIVYLKEPNENGKPKLDTKNPEDKLKTTPLLGLVFMKGFVSKGKTKWEDGTIYDPRNGKTYSCTINQSSPTVLDVRGYIGISLLGRTSKFTKAE